jgi:hypothetical protein
MTITPTDQVKEQLEASAERIFQRPTTLKPMLEKIELTGKEHLVLVFSLVPQTSS